MSKHTLLMLACCLIPMALLGIALATHVSLGGLAPFAMVVLCPLLHVLMMRGMAHDHSAHGGRSDEQQTVPACHDSPRPATTK